MIWKIILINENLYVAMKCTAGDSTLLLNCITNCQVLSSLFMRVLLFACFISLILKNPPISCVYRVFPKLIVYVLYTIHDVFVLLLHLWRHTFLIVLIRQTIMTHTPHPMTSYHHYVIAIISTSMYSRPNNDKLYSSPMTLYFLYVVANYSKSKSF